MPAVIVKDTLVREGRDAAIAAFRHSDVAEPACPYNPGTRRALFWKHGAAQAQAALKLLMKIGT